MEEKCGRYTDTLVQSGRDGEFSIYAKNDYRTQKFVLSSRYIFQLVNGLLIWRRNVGGGGTFLITLVVLTY